MIAKTVRVSDNQPEWHGLFFSDAECDQFMLTTYDGYYRRDKLSWLKLDCSQHPTPNWETLQWLWDNVGDDRYTYWSVDRARKNGDLLELRDYLDTWESSFQLIEPQRRNWTCMSRQQMIAFRDAGHAALFKLTFA